MMDRGWQAAAELLAFEERIHKTAFGLLLKEAGGRDELIKILAGGKGDKERDRWVEKLERKTWR